MNDQRTRFDRARKRSTLVSLAAAWFTACASGGGLRPYAERGAPIVAWPVTAPLKPSTSILLVNPLVCGYVASGPVPTDPYASAAITALLVGCIGVLGAVDLVALPMTAVKRNGEAHEIASINAACMVRDPASRVGDQLADRMIREFGFSVPESRPAPDAVVIVVKTTDFTRSSRIVWKGSVTFGAPEGKVAWRDECRGEAPTRAAATFQQECEVAQAEIAALADSCVDHVVARLRGQWK